jgi:ABC-type transport system substrate-binding protein
LTGVSLAVAGCAPVQTTSSQPPKAATKDVKTVSLEGKDIVEGGDLVMALSNEPDALDPTTSSSLYTRYVMQTMCQKLYDIDENGKVIPFLATALPTLSDDALTATIPLKDGVKFADGTPFNAEAAEKLGASASQVALAWLLRRSPVMLPIPGTGSVDHLEENIGAASVVLDDASYEAIAAAVA